MSEFADSRAKQVHSFALQMGNLGLARVTDLVVAMLESGVWKEFRDGTGVYRFLPGEFDYFLTQQGITRDQLIHGIRDVAVKARLEEAMDERRTGEEGYRRRLADVRKEVPDRPGQPIEPFGYTRAERAFVTTPTTGSASYREPLGRAAREYRRSGGTTTRRPNEERGRYERLRGAVLRLADDELASLVDAISEEQDRRRRAARPSSK
jgi:hypothetical protein